MTRPALILFDDEVARDWMPFTLTRPAGELRFGALTLRERAERVFIARATGHLASEDLAGFDEPDAPPVLRISEIPTDRDLLFWSSRAVPAWTNDPPEFGDRAVVLTIDGEPCGWFAPAGTTPPTEFFERPAAHSPTDTPSLPIEGTRLDRIWQLITGNAEQLERDILALHPTPAPASLHPGVHVIGSAPLVVGPDVEIEPGAVIDLRRGPIWLDRGASVLAFTKLVGPAYVGRESTLLGGPLSAVSIGPVCKVHGEVEESIILGYSNKAHDGFIGHAYVGCWVNLGALTTNSDLKNNYGTVRIWTPAGEVDTGEVKLGCLLGDHVKTAIGTLLNTGTVVGAGTNLFGGSIPPRYVAPFTWGGSDPSVAYELDRFLDSAKVVMARRNVPLSDGQRLLLARAWSKTRGES